MVTDALRRVPSAPTPPQQGTTVPLSSHAALLARWIAFVCVYVALDRLSFVFPHQLTGVTPWNPQAGFSVGMVMIGGAAYAWLTPVAAIISEMVTRGYSVGWGISVMAPLGLGIGYGLIGLLSRDPGERAGALSAAGLRRLGSVAIPLSAIGALWYVGWAVTSPLAALQPSLVGIGRLWLGDLVGIASTTPLLLCAVAEWRLGGIRERRSLAINSLMYLAVLTILLFIVFGVRPIEDYKLFYLLFLPVIGLAIRHGLLGAGIALGTLQPALTLALILTAKTNATAVEFEILMLVLAITALVLGAVTDERREALVQVKRRSEELRARQSAFAEAMRVASASQMASALAHELGQPISALGTYVHASNRLIAQEPFDRARLRDVLAKVADEANRTSEVVRRIREFFRAGIVRLEATSANAVVTDAVNGARTRAEREGVHLVSGAEVPNTTVLVDRVQIQTALLNLIYNAIDAARSAAAAGDTEDPYVQVRADRGPEGLVIEVLDNGRGIEASVRDSLFDALATTKPSGMGLGLAIARSIVEAHGGTLSLTRVGQPTTFTLTLPTHTPDQG